MYMRQNCPFIRYKAQFVLYVIPVERLELSSPATAQSDCERCVSQVLVKY